MSGGWEWYQYTPSSDASLNYGTLFGYTVNGGVTSALSAGQKQNNNVYFVGAKYDFNESVPVLAGLSASLGYYATRNDAIDGPSTAHSSTANTQAAINTTTFVVDYKFNKRFDTYFAYSTNHFYDAKYAAYVPNVDIYGVGVRMKF